MRLMTKLDDDVEVRDSVPPSTKQIFLQILKIRQGIPEISRNPCQPERSRGPFYDNDRFLLRMKCENLTVKVSTLEEYLSLHRVNSGNVYG